MKLKIWNKKNVKASKDKQLFLRLIRAVNDDVRLVVCDMKGEPIDSGTLLIVDQDLGGIASM